MISPKPPELEPPHTKRTGGRNAPGGPSGNNKAVKHGLYTGCFVTFSFPALLEAVHEAPPKTYMEVLETRSSSNVTGFLSGSAIVLPLSRGRDRPCERPPAQIRT